MFFMRSDGDDNMLMDSLIGKKFSLGRRGFVY